MNMTTSFLGWLSIDIPTFLITSVVFVIVAYVVGYVQHYGELPLPPQVPSLPIIGSLPWLKINSVPLYVTLIEYARKLSSKIYIFHLGKLRILVLGDYETIRKAFKVSRYGLIMQGIPFLRPVLKYVDQGFSSVVSINQETFAFIARQVEVHKETLDPESVRDFIDAYIVHQTRSGPQGFDDAGLNKTIFDLFAAGTETTNTTLQWALLLMSINQDVQCKVQQEIDSLKGSQRRISYKDRQQLPYTEATILEVQRVSNIAPLALIHRVAKDTELCGYRIPKDTLVLPNLWWCHMDPAYWPEPSKFDPDRFLDRADGKVTASAKRDSFLPFSLGGRQCMGEPLAKMELFMFFATLLAQFSWTEARTLGREGADFDSSPVDLTPVNGLTLSPRPYTIKATPR